MRDTPDSNLPPPRLLDALRIPRREQIRAMAVWRNRALGDPWGRAFLSPYEIAALRQQAKENSAYFRQAFADLRQRGPSR